MLPWFPRIIYVEHFYFEKLKAQFYIYSAFNPTFTHREFDKIIVDNAN